MMNKVGSGTLVVLAIVTLRLLQRLYSLTTAGRLT